ncbi:nucleoporin-62 C-terminal-like protein [Callithrix jacchus]
MQFTSASNVLTSTAGVGLSFTTSTTATTTVTTTTITTVTSGFTVNQQLSSGGFENRVPYISTVSVVPTSVMTYGQLEGLVNEWNLELEDQEKCFLLQATQVNAWDCTLIENGEMISILHGEVNKGKLDQKRLEQELDFILSQQQELEFLLTYLKESMSDQSGLHYLQHADEERVETYRLAESIDAQLKQMAQDLKDVINHLNTFGSSADSTDSVHQICRILNAHMDSPQWIDQNSGILRRTVEEVTQVSEDYRHKAHAYNVNTAFY